MAYRTERTTRVTQPSRPLLPDFRKAQPTCAFTANSAKARARAIRSRCTPRTTRYSRIGEWMLPACIGVEWASARMLKYFYYSIIALSPSQWPADQPARSFALHRNTDDFEPTRTRNGGLADRSIDRSIYLSVSRGIRERCIGLGRFSCKMFPDRRSLQQSFPEAISIIISSFVSFSSYSLSSEKWWIW